ncbi:putative Dehydrogenase/reductase SDR family member 11 [Hypsibius exemplaris]|uniref:Dehydrogenase/reductase SDR family member 11 n=1 Tax=Hypsibius exemplaris TaxID=2072580 RepID=A0A9X6NI75_HYPEX|nr:putative Dehydrogenase/reductase SDR family member 11 [Hypsibius exemplaris]
MTGIERWKGKTALVTGASTGIGYAIAVGLLEAGVNVIGCARNPTPLEALNGKLPENAGKVTPVRSDLTKEGDILKLFTEIGNRMGHVDILINNAGTGVLGNLVDGETKGWQTMFNLNVLATTICTREYLKLMERDGIEEGHIININSIAGHANTPVNIGLNFYAGTKHMITALTKALTTELAAKKSKIRVTSLSPGMVNTPLVAEMKKDSNSGHFFQSGNGLEAKDVADAALYVLSTPSHVTVSELTIVPGN